MPRFGHIHWDYEQRVCLHLLWNHEQNLSKSERTRVYNHIFQTHLNACGLPDGATFARLWAQYRELKSTVEKTTWKPTWEKVCQPPDTDEDRALRARLAAQIAAILQQGESVGAAIDVNNTLDTPPETPRRTERVKKATQNLYDSYTDPDPVTPVRKQRASAQIDASWVPYATPGPSARKRPAAIQSQLIVKGELDELNDADEEYSPRTKRARQISPHVVIQPSSEIVVTGNTIRTPTKPRYRTGPREGATMQLHRFDGAPIWLMPAEYAEAMLSLVNVTEEDAHPNPPALLFRYWHSKSHGVNSERGFVSSRFSRILVEPRGPPDCDVLEVSGLAIL